MTYGDFKDLARRTTSDKVLRDKHLILLKIQNMMGIKEVLLQWFINFLIKKSKGGSANNEIKQNKQLVEEIHELIIKKITKRRVYSSFKGNILGADLADMQLISRINKGTRFLLFVIGIFSNYALVVLVKEKKDRTIVNAFQKILDNSMRKPNEIWLGKGSEFYNSSFKK